MAKLFIAVAAVALCAVLTKGTCDNNNPIDCLNNYCCPSGYSCISNGQCKKDGCFPSSSQVTLANGTKILMNDLIVGHQVFVNSKESSNVFMFSHRYPEVQTIFVELATDAGHLLQLTVGHYLYVNGAVAPASSVKVGDSLESETGAAVKVSSVSNVKATGLFNPHTLQGDIVVNGIRTTTYTDAIHPTLAHALLAPARAMHTLGYKLD